MAEEERIRVVRKLVMVGPRSWVNRTLACGGAAVEFQDDLSRREYRISGLCQKCQDSVFGEEGVRAKGV